MGNNEVTDVKLSVNDIVCGWYWKLMIDAAPYEKEFDWSLLFPVSYKNQLAPIIPPEYIGNCTLLPKVTMVGKKSEMTLLSLCKKIRERVNFLTSLESDIKEKILWLKNQQHKEEIMT